MSNQSNRTVSITVHAEPKEVGKALSILACTNESYPDPIQVYVPLSTLWEIHPDHVVMDQWIADKKDLVY